MSVSGVAKSLFLGISSIWHTLLLCAVQKIKNDIMKKIGIFYGSSTGTTEGVAKVIAEKLNVSADNVFDVSRLSEELVNQYDLLILGTSTWGDGELQDDWYDALKQLKKMDLSTKEVALFGCGDSDSYSDTFCDGIGILYEELKHSGCVFVGNHVPVSDYRYSSSVSVKDGCFVGLPIDEMNESSKTEERIVNWIKDLGI